MKHAIKHKFNSYPNNVQPRLLALRDFVLGVAHSVGEVEETLKWGEPSYLVKYGSTVRLDWKATSPEYCALYFNCNTTLVDTFKELYPDQFEYQKNRAILLRLEDISPIGLQIDLQITPLKHCLHLAFRYHKLKHLPLLGAG